ncbi:MAG: hypothetical protein VYA55_03465 [Pseudomonadota bacterium]|nr:hypothetical protein [Pseudomonadota bacterium]
MTFIRRLPHIAIVVSQLLLFGCSLTPGPDGKAAEGEEADAQQPLQQCQAQLAQLQRSIQRHGVGDAQYHPVPGFPTYRSNRFWSSFQAAELTAEQQTEWRRTLHQLGMSSLALEWRNLPQEAPSSQTAFTEFEANCDQILFETSLQKPLTQQALQVPDSYNDVLRFFGFYALIKQAAAGSIAEYQQEMRARILAPVDYTRPANIYAAPEPASIPLHQWLASAYEANALHVPQLPAEQIQQALEYFAPRFRIEVETSADLPGAATWSGDHEGVSRHIDHGQPALYTYPSYVRYGSDILLQLNYTLWFSERPKPTTDDWYGGKLDGLVWRVTLQPDGKVLMYDSIHPCGCYHSVHVPADSPLAATVDGLDQSYSLEPILFFVSQLPANEPALELTLEAGTHYLTRVSHWNGQPQEQISLYQLVDYEELRSLPVPGDGAHYRSWFDPHGRIDASARRERFFLWPLGVESAGAMRQQGHQAVAFVGKRHFDEPRLEQLLNLSAPD